MQYEPAERWSELLNEIAKRRKESGMTIKDLADTAGMAERSVSRLLSEPGKNPSLFPVAAICQALHISLDGFFVPSVQKMQGEDDAGHKSEIIAMLKDQVRHRRKLTAVLLTIILVLLTLMALYLILIDARNLDYGLIRR